jgi:hypothetical protein
MTLRSDPRKYAPELIAIAVGSKEKIVLWIQQALIGIQE